jgi:ribosomal protein S18 acetylase RimI-like enzyme
MSYHVVLKLDYNNSDHIDAITKLHNELLPESYVSRLGIFFMKKFYYYNLIRDNLIDGYLYKYDNKYVGFIVCTVHPFNLIKLGLKRSPCKLMSVIALSIIFNPLRLFTILKMLKTSIPGDLISEIGTDSGQFMSFGVLQDYRKLRNDKGKPIPQVLMDKVFEYFNEKNKGTFFLLVLKTNTKAIEFYKKYNIIIPDKYKGESMIIKFRTDNV